MPYTVPPTELLRTTPPPAPLNEDEIRDVPSATLTSLTEENP